MALPANWLAATCSVVKLQDWCEDGCKLGELHLFLFFLASPIIPTILHSPSEFWGSPVLWQHALCFHIKGVQTMQSHALSSSESVEQSILASKHHSIELSSSYRNYCIRNDYRSPKIKIFSWRPYPHPALIFNLTTSNLMATALL